MAAFVLDSAPDALSVRSGGALLCAYRHGPELWKPYLFPLQLPGGPNLLEDAPADHPHHHGLWFGHGKVAEAGATHDVWLERPGAGRIAHASLALHPDGWESCGRWEAADGRTLARDRCRVRLRLGSGRLTLEIDYRLEGERPGMELQGTNEAGLPHIRPAPWVAAKGGGEARDADGRRGESGIFGQPSAWVDCSGVQDGVRWGLRMHDHPENLGRPARWFVRDYGPFSPNDGFFDPQPVALPLRRRYTLVAHRGDLT